jgi:23S rRNA (pseudouridine1915-N3)-methyltransferase
LTVKITLLALGRLKQGPERTLIIRYLERSRDLGKALGFTGFDVVELPESRATRALDRKQEEGRLLLSRLEGMTFIALDETGQSPTSDAFAQWHSNFRDNGTRNLVFVLGGADGLDSTVTKAAYTKLAFGAMTLPHQLARIVLCEQLYRAMTLLAGHPYHRV